MSWCRWSTDIDNKCNSDLYIYDSVGDVIAVHVAGRRRTNYKVNPYMVIGWSGQTAHDDEWVAKYIANNKLRNQWFEDNDSWEDLPEEYAGKHYNFEYYEMDSLKEFLIQARKDGINFPDYVFELIDELEEQNESSS